MKPQATKILMSIVTALMLLNTACSGSSSSDDSGGGGGGTATGLTMTPNPASVAAGASQVMIPSGGVGPYTFSLISSIGGTISPTVGTFTTFTAGSTAGVVQLSVTSSNGLSGIVFITVTGGGGGGTFALSPLNPSVTAGGTTTFTASGGTAPYHYSVITPSGGTITSAGVYTAPSTAGTYTIQAYDSATPTPHVLTTTVTVTSGTSGVGNCSGQYQLSLNGYPGSLWLQADTTTGNLYGIMYIDGSTANVTGSCSNGYIAFTNTYSGSGYTGNYFVNASNPRSIYMAGTFQWSGSVYSWQAQSY